MTVYRVEQSLKASEPLNDRPLSATPRVISQEAIKRAFENGLCQKMIKLAQKKNSLHCAQDGQKIERKRSETCQETTVECSNGSEASEEEHPFVE